MRLESMLASDIGPPIKWTDAEGMRLVELAVRFAKLAEDQRRRIGAHTPLVVSTRGLQSRGQELLFGSRPAAARQRGGCARC